jgi:hypothetical protein
LWVLFSSFSEKLVWRALFDQRFDEEMLWNMDILEAGTIFGCS